jgi:hypothetical protein
MDALPPIIRPMPQTPPTSSGAAPAPKPSGSTGKPDDTPAFAPADQPSPTEGEKKASNPKEAQPAETTGTDAPEPELKPSQEADASTDEAATAAANANTLLIAQAAAAATPPEATPVVAPVVAVPPQPTSNTTNKSDAASAIGAVSSKPTKPAAPATPAAPSPAAPTAASQPAPTPQPATQPATQPDAAIQTSEPAPAGGMAVTPPAPQQNADGTAPTTGQSNALDALLNGAKPQTTQPSAPQPQTQAGTPPAPAQAGASQPAQPQPAQVAQLASTDLDAKPAATDHKPDVDTPLAARATSDATPPPALSFGTDPGAAAHVKTATAAYEAARTATPILPASEQVAMQIHRAIEDGVDKLTVELKPAELGRVSAEIQFHDDHRVHVVLSADRPATLDALRNDSRALERALQDAGLRADAGSLSFRFENGGGQPGFTPDGSADGIALPVASGMSETETSPLAPTAYARFTRPGGIDIHV